MVQTIIVSGPLSGGQITKRRIGEVRAAKIGGRLAWGDAEVNKDFDLPVDPAFAAAKSSGLLAVMGQDEVLAYLEGDSIGGAVGAAYVDWRRAKIKLQAFHDRFAYDHGQPDLSNATSGELDEYIGVLIDYAAACDELKLWGAQMQGVQAALLGGERNIATLYKAERTLTKPN